uniref:Retrotransposable element Tf2 n=1 Tax=Cajanus cajan TaxID=3821 RepID=A0A151R6J8_CAJCA|nr:Retrotransposable element Tf2 [Cajanus cajan]
METKPPSNKKELQSLLCKINFLRRFISNLSGKTKVFSPLLRLKKEEEFRWDENHQKAFEEIKTYLMNPPVMVPPSEGRKLKLYVSANDSTIAGMLSQDDENGIERAIYYINKMLVEAEIRYTPLEKLCLSLYYACTTLKHYIKPYDVFVFCQNNVIKYMLSKPILHSRVAKWALALTDYSLTFVPLKATKGKVIADFLVDHSNLTKQVNYLTTKSRELFFDGSKHDRECLESLICIRNELSDEHECLTIATSTIQDWRKELIEYLQSPNSQAERKVKYRALNCVILNDELYKRGFDEFLFKCLRNHESYIAMAEVHEGICGAHQAGEKMKWTLSRKGYFWPSMFKDCIKFAKGCEECQKHGPIHRVPAIELHTIVKPWPFRAIGQVEAANKVIIALIKKHISGKPQNWHETLLQVLRAYRNSPKNATQTTPYKLVYGHEVILPIDINLQSVHV